jgi:hypothetical protein
MPKSVIVQCPCCKMLLDVDVASATVVRHFEKGKQGKADPSVFDRSVSKVEERLRHVDDRFSSALSHVEDRTRKLEEKLREAREKVEREEEEGGSEPVTP